MTLQMKCFALLKLTYRLFPLHELAFCKLLIRYKLEPEHPRVATMPEGDTQSPSNENDVFN